MSKAFTVNRGKYLTNSDSLFSLFLKIFDFINDNRYHLYSLFDSDQRDKFN